MSRFWSRRAALGIVAGFAAVAFVTPASAQGTLAKAKAAGVLKVGIADNLPWSRMEADGSVSGIAPLQVRAVAAKMGIAKVEAIVAPYGQLVPGLMAGRWDMIGASLTITPERCAQVLFADPFYRADEKEWMAYIPGTITGPLPKSFVDIAKTFPKVGMVSGSMLPYMQKAVADNGNKTEIVQFADMPALIEALLAKRVPIATADAKSMELFKKQRGAAIDITPVDSGTPNRGSGGAFRKEDADFRDAFVKEQRALKESGEVTKILAQYDFKYDPAFMTISGDDACKL